MKLKVYILKKSQIITALIIAFILLLSIILIITFKSKETMKNVNPVQTVYCDVDGDKKLDTMYIKSNTNNLDNIKIETKKGDGFILEPDPLIKTFGTNTKSWPIYIECKDINNDNNQEIIIQGSNNNKPILHVFSYNNKDKKITKVISGEYNVFASTIHENTPIIMLGVKNENNLNFSYYTYKETFKKEKPCEHINFATSTLNSLSSFIDEDNVEVVNTSNSNLSLIEKGNFLDAILIDVKYKDNIPHEYTYQVRTLPYGDDTKAKIYEIKLSPNTYKNYNIDYRINSINFIK